MARGALQVVGHGPVEFVAQCLLDQVGHDRRCAAELGVTKCIAGTLFSQKRSVGVMAALGNHHGANAGGNRQIFSRAGDSPRAITQSVKWPAPAEARLP